MTGREIPDRVLDFIREQSGAVDWGSIKIVLGLTGFIDVTIDTRTRFAVPERDPKAHKPAPGQVVNEKNTIFLVDSDEKPK